MLVDLHPDRNLVDGMIFPNDLSLLKFGMGHCHHYYRSTFGLAETSLSLVTGRIRPAQCDPGVFALFLIEDPVMNAEFSPGERSLVPRQKIGQLYTAMKGICSWSMYLTGPVMGLFQKPQFGVFPDRCVGRDQLFHDSRGLTGVRWSCPAIHQIIRSQ